ncbi:MAG: hypothetical protein AABX98_02440 [Nanoarchaeota archaeon]
MLPNTEKEQEEHPFFRYAKRIAIFCIGLFLLYLMTTYFGIGPYILQIFEGQIVSEQLDANYTLFLGNGTTVIFDEAMYAELLAYYIAHQRYEFAACFMGNLTFTNGGEGGKIYLLTAMEIPHTYSQSVHRVVSSGCPAETLVSLHTHPYKHCLFSEQDINSFFVFHQRSPTGLFALMCEEDRFTFYGY